MIILTEGLQYSRCTHIISALIICQASPLSQLTKYLTALKEINSNVHFGRIRVSSSGSPDKKIETKYIKGDGTGCHVKPVSILETRIKISISSLRRKREFLSFNLVVRDKNGNFLFQSQASRRERESRFRQLMRTLENLILACLIIDIFIKRRSISKLF